MFNRQILVGQALLTAILVAAISVQSSTARLNPGSSTNLIQNTINRLLNGDTLYLPEGDYLLTEAIKLNRDTNIAIIGQSQDAVVRFSSQYHYISGNVSWSNPMTFNLFNIVKCSNITIRNLHFKGTTNNYRSSGPFNSGIFIDSSINITVTNCEFEDNLSNGIYAFQSVSNCNFTNNFMHGRFYSSGIVLNSATCAHNKISNNTIDYGNGLGAMGIWIINGTNNNRITSNIIKGCNAEAIVCEGPGATTSGTPGIPSSSDSICSNKVSNCSYGIVLRSHLFGIVDSNEVRDCSKVGIQLFPENDKTYQVKNNIVSGNLVINCGTSEDPNCPDAGILVGTNWSNFPDANTIIGNTVIGGKNGIYVKYAKNCTIMGNNIRNVRQQRVVVIKANTDTSARNPSEFH